PVSVKHRIGIDDADSYDDMLRFVDAVEAASGGAPVAYTVHARKAWLQGLSPKENRTVPPLRYEDVYRLKRERPWLTVELNGGVPHVAAALEHLRHVDGVMIGRAFYDDPVLMADVDPALGGGARHVTRRQVVEGMAAYAAEETSSGTPLHAIAKHLLNLFKGAPGGRAWRRALTEGSHRPGAGPELLLAALRAVPDEVLDAPLGAAAAGGRAAAWARGGTRRSPRRRRPPAALVLRRRRARLLGADGAQQLARDDQVLDLVRALADAGQAGVAPVALDGVVLRVAVAAEDLYRGVAGRHARGAALQLRHRRGGGVLPARVAQGRGLAHEQARCLQLHRHLRELERD